MSDQLVLFPDKRWPAGLRYEPAFVSGEEERALITGFAELRLAPFQFGAFEGKRRIASFGQRYDFSDQRLHPAEPFPPWIVAIVRKVEAFAVLPAGAIQHVLFAEYQAGVGIGWHRDKAVFDLVFGLSLASSCKLRFRRKQRKAWERMTLNAAPRSLYLMSGEARGLWEHSIPPVEALRYSITFRTMTRGSQH